MIPTEDNYVAWFTCAIRFEFLREGYAFLDFSMDQVADPGFPSSKLLAAGSRLIGLQFARPAAGTPAGGTLEYEVDPARHRAVSGAADGWLLYALPRSADPLDQQLMHQKVLFAGVKDVEVTPGQHLVPREAQGFKQLVACMEKGTCGCELPSDDPAEAFLALARENAVSLYLVLDRRARIVTALKA